MVGEPEHLEVMFILSNYYCKVMYSLSDMDTLPQAGKEKLSIKLFNK